MKDQTKGLRKATVWFSLITIGAIIGIIYFSDVSSTPYYSSGYGSVCVNSQDRSSCNLAEYPLYLKDQSDAGHWRTAMIVIAIISGLLVYGTWGAAKDMNKRTPPKQPVT